METNATTKVMPEKAIWYLKITSFVGATTMARHHYGTLHGPKKVGLQRVLTAADAEQLNRLDRTFDRDYFTWSEGDATNRFNHEHELESAAVAVFKAIAGLDDLLVLGDPAYGEPHKPLAGPESVTKILSGMVEVCEQLGWWDGEPGGYAVKAPGYDSVAVDRDETMNALCDHWAVIAGRYAPTSRELSEDAYLRPVAGGWEYLGCEEPDTEPSER